MILFLWTVYTLQGWGCWLPFFIDAQYVPGDDEVTVEPVPFCEELLRGPVPTDEVLV